MILTRRFQIMPAYAYCRTCGWTDSGTSCGSPAAVKAEAREHRNETGHETRAFTGSQTIFRQEASR